MPSKAGSTLRGEQQSGKPKDQTPVISNPNYASCCPQDVLRLIFEVTVSASGNPDTNLQQACLIASVCRAWRSVALSTPRIWNNICLRMGPNDDGLQEYWARTIERVKKVPVTIKISNICSQWPMEVLRMIHEASLPVDSLHLVLAHRGDIGRLRVTLGEMRIEVKDFFVSSKDTVMSDKHGDSLWETGVINCGELAKTVCCRRSLSFSGWGECNFFFSSINASFCLQLHLSNVTTIDTTYLFLTFPLLEALRLSNCRLWPVSGLKHIPGLHSLQIEDSDAANWLTQARFPDLCHFSYLDYHFPQLMQFLALHRTITTLNLGDAIFKEAPFDELAESASQIISLTMPAEWTYSLTEERNFPSLRALTIVDYPSMPVAQFESFLKARCLPLSHPQSTAKSPSLVIDDFFVDFHKDDLLMRRMSEVVLYAEATKEVQPEYDSHRIRIKLSWLMP